MITPTVEAVKEATGCWHGDEETLKEIEVLREALAGKTVKVNQDVAFGFAIGLETARRMAWKSKLLFEAGIDPGDLF